MIYNQKELLEIIYLLREFFKRKEKERDSSRESLILDKREYPDCYN